ncbi:shikimate dehydrogenase (NADP(+)) [Bordetella sputigena]|uniref:shikimate dehydrogenase family protein n=1 Tax=Bordetella sputigena TaxID=1416810 RepID=UPI0039F08167
MNTAQATPALSGTTRLYAIIGDPIAQVGSPRLFNAAFRARGIDAVLVAMHVAPSDLGGMIAIFRAMKNFDGLIVTVPHKIQVAGMIDTLGGNAARLGAVNTIRKLPDGRLLGDNFDGIGFVRGLAGRGIELAGKKVLVIGAGGAGCAVVNAIADQRAARIGVYDIDANRRDELLRSVAAHVPGAHIEASDPVAAGFDVVVNCTSVGMKQGDPLPVDISGLAARTVVADIILKPVRTPLLEAAARLGCITHEGPAMLEGQVDAVMDFFFPTSP